MITLTVHYPGWKPIRISTDDASPEEVPFTRTLITMLLSSYRDNGCQL